MADFLVGALVFGALPDRYHAFFSQTNPTVSNYPMSFLKGPYLTEPTKMFSTLFVDLVDTSQSYS